MKGKFISLEGGEGAGKSSAIHVIKAWLEERNIEYVLTREPGGTPMAEEIRELVLASRDEAVAVDTELLLVFAARVQHINTTILPALAEGKWVVSDRFVDSSYVYQGIGRGIDKSIIDMLRSSFLEGCMPDKTLLLDVPVELGLSRVASRGDANRLDGESTAFHEAVRSGFLELAADEPARFAVLDASQTMDNVAEQILQQLSLLEKTS